MKKLLKWLVSLTLLILFIVGIILSIAYYNRDKLLAALTAELNQGINGKVQVEKIDFTFFHNFPSFSITLQNISLRDSLYETYKRDVIFARKIFADVRLYPLLKNEIHIKTLTLDDANIFIFRAQNGYTNSDVFKNPAKSDKKESNVQSSTPLLLTLNKITFQNVSVLFADTIKNKFMNFSFLNTNQSLLLNDSLYEIGIEGEMHFDGLTFNANAGSFLSNKSSRVNLQVSLNTFTQQLIINPSSLKFKNSLINISGELDLKKQGKYSLLFESKGIDPVEIKTLLNKRLNKTLQKFDIQNPVDISVALSGKSVPGNLPSVDVKFDTKNSTFKYGTLDFSDLTLLGSYTNHVDSTKTKDDNNSAVSIQSFSGKMQQLPVKGKVEFTKLDDPVINLSVTTKLGFKKINDQLDTDRFKLRSGNFTSEVSYTGKLSEYLNYENTKYHGKLNGRVTAKNASLYYEPKKILLSDINALFEFDENKFEIKDLELSLNGSNMKINGSMLNFIPFFIKPINKGYIKLNVTSSDLDLTALSTKKKTYKKSKVESKKEQKKMSDLFDVVYQTLEFDLNVKIDQFTYKKFSGKDFAGRVKLDNNKLIASPLSMKVAGGTMDLSFTLSRLYDPISPVDIEAHVHDADIQKFFYYFNNFNQNTIHGENLEGTISADINFSAEVNDSYAVFAPTMQGTLDCKIMNGVLKNFEPMENMSNFLFKKRDFSNVKFAELNSRLSVVGTNMDIEKMEIQSSVLSLFLQGRYSFTDSTSLSVQLPLSNLKKRHKNFKPENIGTHAKAGPSVFLHVYRNKDINSKINIDYDPFKKWVKN